MNKDRKQSEGAREACRADLPNLKCELTTGAIHEWFDSMGIRNTTGMSSIEFVFEGNTYGLLTDGLPMISLVKRYELNLEEEDIFVRVMQEVDHAGRLVKAMVERDDDGKGEALLFFVSWFEGSLEHFKEVMKDYMDTIDDAIEISHYYYKMFSEEKKNEKTAQLYPTIESTQQ